MAGLYPDDQDINIFGEIIKFPSMGTDGKFTNGDFKDPKKPASFIPAETMNLIIDNLNNLIEAFGLEPNNTSETQLKEAIENKLKNYVCPIGSYYIQPAKPDGTFDDTAAPSKLWEGTVWELLYNTESIFLRTEGSLSEASRSDGIQPYGMKKITGTIRYRQSIGIAGSGEGVFYTNPTPTDFAAQSIKASKNGYITTAMDTSRVIKSYEDDIVVRNRLIRIYKRIA